MKAAIKAPKPLSKLLKGNDGIRTLSGSRG
jgi:hypothetical protein